MKPCPFCGSNEVKVVRIDVEPQNEAWYGKKMETFVLCSCGVCLFDDHFHVGFDTSEEAVEAWNRRSDVHQTRT